MRRSASASLEPSAYVNDRHAREKSRNLPLLHRYRPTLPQSPFEQPYYPEQRHRQKREKHGQVTNIGKQVPPRRNGGEGCKRKHGGKRERAKLFRYGEDPAFTSLSLILDSNFPMICAFAPGRKQGWIGPSIGLHSSSLWQRPALLLRSLPLPSLQLRSVEFRFLQLRSCLSSP